VMLQVGMRLMFAENEVIFYYFTLLNYFYPQPDLPKWSESGIIKVMYPLESSASIKTGKHVQLMGCG
ncbi:hypothetical protein RA267_28730, partial [Pseudomonas syringae pv. tagetis]|uniref:hypothetical protein n=1 Tax=Pseudomonas syringae group genomosp. 7 TaxID=251699 RepID=UPI00376FF51D